MLLLPMVLRCVFIPGSRAHLPFCASTVQPLVPALATTSPQKHASKGSYLRRKGKLCFLQRQKLARRLTEEGT